MFNPAYLWTCDCTCCLLLALHCRWPTYMHLLLPQLRAPSAPPAASCLWLHRCCPLHMPTTALTAQTCWYLNCVRHYCWPGSLRLLLGLQNAHVGAPPAPLCCVQTNLTTLSALPFLASKRVVKWIAKFGVQQDIFSLTIAYSTLQLYNMEVMQCAIKCWEY
jgi:hypothetical protein